MQFQADLLGCELRRPQNIETTSLGAAYLAGLGVGYWSGVEELRQLRTTDDIFTRKMAMEQVEGYLDGWKDAVRRTL
jgi:glycerol kinase